MKVLMISQNYPPFLGGYAIFCAETTRMLRDRGHDVLVLTSRDESGDDEVDGVIRLLEGAPVEGYRSVSPFYLLRQLARRRILMENRRRTEWVAGDFRPDAVFFWQFDAIGIGLFQVIGQLGIPALCHIGDLTLCVQGGFLRYDLNPFWRLGRRWLYGANVKSLEFPHLILSSSALRDYYAAHGFRGQQMTVVPNGIDERWILRESRKAGSGLKLLYAGRVDRGKGIETALEALATLRVSGTAPFTLDIIGSGREEYLEELKRLAGRLGITGIVRFHGYLPRDVLLRRYEDYDMLLFPSTLFEGFGMTIIEAMARGVPVVASDRGGPQDIIRDGIDGLLVEPESAGAMARGVLMLASRPGMRQAMGERALESVRERFTLQENVRRVEEILQAMARGGGS